VLDPWFGVSSATKAALTVTDDWLLDIQLFTGYTATITQSHTETLGRSHSISMIDETNQGIQRQAFIGFAASVVSDTISNSLRVVKTYRQVHEGDVGYSKSYICLDHTILRP
jgi:hypothetical protein